MKIKKVITKKTQITEFSILKSKKKFNLNIKPKVIKTRIKKSLKIIKNYHISNKKIIFIGVPAKIQKQLKKKIVGLKHLFIPKNTWINGVLTNRKNLKKNLERTKKRLDKNHLFDLNKLLILKENPCLIVILTDYIQDNDVLIESYKLKIPVICLSNNLVKNEKVTYNIPIEFDLEDNTYNNFYLLMLFSMFKRMT